MAVGVFTVPTPESIAPHALALAAEERGFESVWFTEHTNIPTSRASPYPAGGELPTTYMRMLDPFVSLAAAAAVTKRIKLGTGVCLVAQRDPILTAKEVSTLDLLSGGRLQFGVGFGWNIEEFANHGRSPSDRWRIAREHVLAMRELWTKEEAEFHGDYVNIERCWQWPKPVQQPHPPVLVGGRASLRTFERIADYGDGWLPLGSGGAESIATALGGLREALERRGRSLAEIQIVPFGLAPDSAEFERLHQLGVRRVVLRMDSSPESDSLRFLDDNADLIARWAA